MLGLAAGIGADKAFSAGLLIAAFGLGFRHGIDWDHIAAITDITSSRESSRRSMFFATLYALGHAFVVFVLGFVAIVLAARLPSGVDHVMERVVGATLILLGLYVFYALATKRSSFRMRSRWMLLFAGVHTAYRWAHARLGRNRVELHEHEPVHAGLPTHSHRGVALSPSPGDDGHAHRHVSTMPADPFTTYAPRTAFGIGMIHGVGAETPTQVLIFLTAAGVGGKGLGLLLLVCFLVGLLMSNTLIAAAGTLGFLSAARNFGLYVTVSLLTAFFSVLVGAILLLGNATKLPALLSG